MRKLCRLPSPVVSDCIAAIRQGGNQPIAMAANANRTVWESILAAPPQKRPTIGPPPNRSRSSRLAERFEESALDMDSNSSFTTGGAPGRGAFAALTGEKN